MAITKSAKKAIRVAGRKRVMNLRRKAALYDANKAFDKAPSAAALSTAYQAIDKAAKRGVISKNAASRKKARLARSLKKAA